MINWGIIGLGRIAHVFCNGLRFSKTGRVAAVASRDPSRAQDFGRRFSVPKIHPSYEALLEDESVDAVYIASIHPTHHTWAVKAAEAGKHVLVEKPMGLNHREVSDMVNAAEAHDVFLMEAFMYRCHPQMRTLVELIQDEAIGEVKSVRTAFGYRAVFDPASRIFSHEVAGGAIMDVGCYPVSAARLVAGAVSGKTFADPVEVRASGCLGPTGVDHDACAVLKFENGLLAQLSTSITCNLAAEITIFGTDGVITVPNPWLPSSPSSRATKPLGRMTAFPSSEIHVYAGARRKPRVIKIKVDRDLYTYEADTVAAHIGARQAPAMTWDDSAGNVRVLDEWRAQVGLRFQQDD